MGSLFNESIIRPIFNLLMILYNWIPGADFGVSIIVLTLVIRVIMSPIMIRTQKAQRQLGALNPKLKELKEKHKDNPTAQSEAIMKLYKEHNINPLSGCLPLLLQIPIIIGLYQALLAGFKPESLSMLYGFVDNPGSINTLSFGFLDVTMRNSFLAGITGAVQFIQGKLSVNAQTTDPSPTARALNTQLLYFFPIMVVFITWRLPAGLGLYWITTTLFSIGEQLYIKYRST